MFLELGINDPLKCQPSLSRPVTMPPAPTIIGPGEAAPDETRQLHGIGNPPREQNSTTHRHHSSDGDDGIPFDQIQNATPATEPPLASSSLSYEGTEYHHD
tara:strand:- start:293 stop:595 length:303 start_codon:yes stop_codon:yes gene_type:complete